MIDAGLPVPDGFVVTSQALHASTPPNIQELLAPLESASATDFDTINQVSGLVRDAMHGVELESDLLDAISVAHRQLQSDAVSVRSSATAEDMADASFAGQYETFLNILNFDNVVLRIRDVWASLHSPRAIAYRIQAGLDHEAVRMAVVIQNQLQPDASGVLFTRDPVTGTHRFVASASLGLGEGVVAGEAPADQFQIDPDTGIATSTQIVSKDAKVVSVPSGGIERVEVPDSDRLQPTLSALQIQELSEMARSLEDLFGGPQDIEFAVADNTVHLLQSRPITTLDTSDDVDWEEGLDTSRTWSLVRLSALKGPVYRLQLDFGLVYMDNMRLCYQETASMMSRGHLIHQANGYVFTSPPDDDPAIVAQRQQRQAEKCKAYIDQGTTNYLEEMVPKINQIHADLRKLRSVGTSIQARVNYLVKCIDAAGFIMGHLHWCMIDRANQLDWPAEFHNITGEPAEDSDVFLQAIPNRTTRLVSRLRNLARLVREDPVLASAFAEGSFEVLESPQHQNRPNARIFSTQFRAMMKEYGFRTGWGFGSGVTFEHPTWNMALSKPLELIASYAQQDIDHLESMEARALKQRQLLTRRIRRKLADRPDQLDKFEFTRKRAQSDVARMEDHNYLMEQSTVGQMREAMHLMGESLVKTGLIEDPADVLHISLDELKQLADGHGPDNVRSLVTQRADERDRLAKLTPPATLGKPPQPTNADQPEDSSTNETGNVLRGRTASRGRATGRARVLDAGGTPPRFQKGDILVTTNVGPDWTPFFPLLSGIVLDDGEIFQHPALVAREYRIPAVFQTKVGTTRIRDGQTITVDGGAGVVELGVPGEE
jgi:pyruvate,water dikinase